MYIPGINVCIQSVATTAVALCVDILLLLHRYGLLVLFVIRVSDGKNCWCGLFSLIISVQTFFFLTFVPLGSTVAFTAPIYLVLIHPSQSRHARSQGGPSARRGVVITYVQQYSSRHRHVRTAVQQNVQQCARTILPVSYTHLTLPTKA